MLYLFLAFSWSMGQPPTERIPLSYIALTFCSAWVLLTGLSVAWLWHAIRTAPYEGPEY